MTPASVTDNDHPVPSRGCRMLDLGHDDSPVAVAWEAAEKQTRLPDHMQPAFQPQAPARPYPGCRRKYQRFHVKSKAILRWRDINLGVYTTDASRKGVRFLSPVELAPKERGGIRLPNAKEFQIEIVRCRHIDDCCYECGAG